MCNLQAPSARALRRLKRAAEILVEDSSLREGLTDVQAQRLLNWALAHATAEASRTSEMEDEIAMPLLKEEVAKVRRLMRLVARIMGSKQAAANAPDMDTPIISLLKNASQLTGRNPTPSILANAERVALHRQAADNETLFELLMTLLRLEPDPKLDEEA
jgi:hypothetical protein